MIRASLEAFAQIGLPVAIQNAANAIALSEFWFGSLRGISNAIVVTVSEGIGTGILTDGRLLSGWNGMAGEFGHVVLDPNGPQCGCGRHGCWEVLASDQAIVGLAARKHKSGTNPPRDYEEILAAALDEERWALALIEKQYRALGSGLRLVLPFAPEVVLVAGRLTGLWDRFEAILHQEIASGAMPGYVPRLYATADADHARLTAATAVILQMSYSAGISDPMSLQET